MPGGVVISSGCLKSVEFIGIWMPRRPGGGLGSAAKPCWKPLLAAVAGRLRHLDYAADLDDGLELADDLLRRVPGPFHGEAPGPAWPDGNSHPPWTDFRGPHHQEDPCRDQGTQKNQRTSTYVKSIKSISATGNALSNRKYQFWQLYS